MRNRIIWIERLVGWLVEGGRYGTFAWELCASKKKLFLFFFSSSSLSCRALPRTHARFHLPSPPPSSSSSFLVASRVWGSRQKWWCHRRFTRIQEEEESCQSRSIVSCRRHGVGERGTTGRWWDGTGILYNITNTTPRPEDWLSSMDSRHERDIDARTCATSSSSSLQCRWGGIV